MVSKLQKMRDRLMAKKGNKGFTLVELIVVIVILAILVGVTIGGVYGYVQKSRINTDINNASAIASALAPVSTNRNVTCTGSATPTEISAQIKAADMKSSALGLVYTAPTGSTEPDPASLMFPQGIDAPKTQGAKYKITYTVDGTNHVTSVKVEAVDSDGNPLVAQE